MVDKLWFHALSFLENYRYVLVIIIFSKPLMTVLYVTWVSDGSQRDLNHFYDFKDETGILERHRELFVREFQSEDPAVCNVNEVGADIKIMFCELIKLICDFESPTRVNQRQIYKIDGFQQLSNKLFLSKMRILRDDCNILKLYLFLLPDIYDSLFISISWLMNQNYNYVVLATVLTVSRLMPINVIIQLLFVPIFEANFKF